MIALLSGTGKEDMRSDCLVLQYKTHIETENKLVMRIRRILYFLSISGSTLWSFAWRDFSRRYAPKTSPSVATSGRSSRYRRRHARLILAPGSCGSCDVKFHLCADCHCLVHICFVALQLPSLATVWVQLLLPNFASV